MCDYYTYRYRYQYRLISCFFVCVFCFFKPAPQIYWQFVAKNRLESFYKLYASLHIKLTLPSPTSKKDKKKKNPELSSLNHCKLQVKSFLFSKLNHHLLRKSNSQICEFGGRFFGPGKKYTRS